MNSLSSVEHESTVPRRRRRRRQALAVMSISALVATACSSDDDEAAEATSAPVETTAEAAAPESTDATASTETADSVADSTDAAETGEAQTINVDLLEFEIVLDADVAEGPVDFELENTGQFPHQMTVYRGTYADLPQLASGAVDDAAVAAGDNLGATDRLNAGETASLSVEFTPGTYTLICNLEGGGSSHAARGQVIEVQVG